MASYVKHISNLLLYDSTHTKDSASNIHFYISLFLKVIIRHIVYLYDQQMSLFFYYFKFYRSFFEYVLLLKLEKNIIFSKRLLGPGSTVMRISL